MPDEVLSSNFPPLQNEYDMRSSNFDCVVCVLWNASLHLFACKAIAFIFYHWEKHLNHMLRVQRSSKAEVERVACHSVQISSRWDRAHVASYGHM